MGGEEVPGQRLAWSTFRCQPVSKVGPHGDLPESLQLDFEEINKFFSQNFECVLGDIHSIFADFSNSYQFYIYSLMIQ